MPRRSTLINGLGVDLGRCADVQPAGFAIQRANSQPAPIAAGQSDTCLHAATDLYAATTFTPLPPTMTPTFLPPVVAPVNVPPPTPFDPILIIGGGLIVLAVLVLAWLRQRRCAKRVDARAADGTRQADRAAATPDGRSGV